MDKQTLALALGTLLLARGGPAPPFQGPALSDATEDMLLFDRPGGSPQALLALGTPLVALGQDQAAGDWIHVRLEGWVNPDAGGAELSEGSPASLAPTLFSTFQNARASGRASDGRVPLEGLRLLAVDQVRAKARGSNVQIDYQIVVENRTGITLAGLQVEFVLLNRRGRALVTRRADLAEPTVLPPHGEGTFRFQVELTRSQQRDYHRRRYRTAFYLTGAD